MNSSGLMNRINGTDLSLIIIAVFLSLLFGFVGYRCCRRRRSSGKKKGLQRQIKKSSARKSQESGQLLKGTSANFEELNENKKELQPGHSEDKNIITPSSSNGSTQASKHRPVSAASSSASSSPKVGEKNRNAGDYKKPSTPIFAGIWRVLSRRGDIETGEDSTRETLPITSSMDKKKDKNTKSQSSNFNKEPPKKKSQSKQESDIELSRVRSTGTRNQKSTTSRTETSHAGLFVDTNSKEKSDKNKGNYNKSGFKRSSSKEHCTMSCTGSDICKKCKPFKETSDGNETVKEEERVSHQERSRKGLKLRGNDDDFIHVPYSTPKEDAKVVSPSEDIDMVCVDKNTREDDTPLPCTSSGATDCIDDEGYVVVDAMVDGTRASENTPSLRMHPRSLDEGSYEKVEAPMGGGMKEAPMGMKESLPAEVPLGNRIVGNVYDVLEYASREWKGGTIKAETIRKGYFEVPKQLGLHNLRVVRGDNYCAIRATLFQALAKKIPILPQYEEILNEEILNIPRKLVAGGLDWIMEWSFGARFHVERNKVCERMEECLKELYDLVNLNSKMVNEEGRVSHLLSSLNYKPKDFDVRLMEAVKFLMLACAIKLYKSVSSGGDVPVFAMIMFARDTSPDPCQFMKRHLNAVGDTGGLEQVEMFLLGYTLGITIQVVRPSHFGKPDFIASYPDDMPVETPTVTLIAEDDRHYNILS